MIRVAAAAAASGALTLALLVALDGPLAVGAFEVLVVALAVIGVRWIVPSGQPSLLRRRTERSTQPPVPSGLQHLERTVRFSSSTAFDVEYRLYPVLVELARERLSTRRGVDFDVEPERAHAALGDDAWQLLRPDRTQSGDIDAPGLPLARMDAVLAAIERL